MKETLLLAIACLFAGFLQAQDTLYRVDGTRQIVRIIEVNPALVRYVPFSDPDGPIYVLSKQAVARIIYENGTVDSFQAIREPVDTPAVILSMEPFNRNILSLGAGNIPWGAFTVGYEHLTESGQWGLRVPLSLGLVRQYGDKVKMFKTGLFLNFYPFGQERITYYAGLSFLCGRNMYYDYYCFYEIQETGLDTGYFLYNGIFIPILGDLGLSAQLGIGLGKDARGHTHFPIPLEINICYKF